MLYNGYWPSGWFLPLTFGFGGLVVLLVLWSFIWKGLALWRAAKEDSRGWFVALLVINTLGILEILYLFVFSRPARRNQS